MIARKWSRFSPRIGPRPGLESAMVAFDTVSAYCSML